MTLRYYPRLGFEAMVAVVAQDLNADKYVLMIAYQYPPLYGGSGLLRTLKFSDYLRNHGWHPIILSTHVRTYSRMVASESSGIPAGVVVKRAFALDAAKHLSLRGKYLAWSALPDRWGTWWLGAVPAGLALIRRYRPRVIWSTYPIATAHLIGLTLHRLTGIPWVADFRDPMMRENRPPGRLTECVHQWIERKTVRHCAAAVFTTEGAAALYAQRHREIPPNRWKVIPNGFDEEAFVEAERLARSTPARGSERILLHSGHLYLLERDPRPFLSAVAQLKRDGKVSDRDLRIVLRDSGNEAQLKKWISDLGIDGIITLRPALPYQEALAEMLTADGLLIFQGPMFRRQVPAKLYEYLRAGHPILALTGSGSETASILKDVGSALIAPIDSRDAIYDALLAFLGQLNTQTRHPADVGRYSRKAQTTRLARLLDDVSR